MKCEHGFRGEIDGTLTAVIDKASCEREVSDIEQELKKYDGAGPLKERLQEIRKKVEKMSSDFFKVKFEWACDCGQTNVYEVPHLVFPNTKEWAKGKVGKRFRVIVTQLPRGAGASVDLREIEP